MNARSPVALSATAPRKKSANRDWLRALQSIATIEKDSSRLLADVFDAVASARKDAPALFSDHESFSFQELVARSNRYARWALAQGFEKGDVVGLMMENRAEYVAIWHGLNRVGVVVALLNVNLSGAAVAHCISVSNARHVIASDGFRDVCLAALSTRDLQVALFTHGGSGGDARIDRDVERLSSLPLLPHERRDVTLADHALYIYTSGTTGLPKAAIVSHHRILSWSLWFAGLIGASPSDRMYDCLPLYHSVGGVVAIWAPLLAGGSVAIREGFSASRFWDEIVQFDCTLFQYIGELCRYLVNSPLGVAEKTHRLRLAVGNGLRPDVWREFQTRFGVARILEFYAATESNFSLYNVEGEIGAVRRTPSFLWHRFQTRLVKFDVEGETVERDENGRCIRCAAGEAGEAIAKIEPRGAETNFEGYLNRAESEKKILRDVFEAGDAWMRSGDLMRQDARGFYYFVDRIGDTFRWKGENVATSEVAHILCACPGVADATVYGVEIGGHDGRAGMAAVVIGDGFDLQALRRHVEAQLPAFARPLFLRIGAALGMTETFKHKKRALALEGFDPRRIDDAIYFARPGEEAYARLDAALYERIAAGEFRL